MTTKRFENNFLSFINNVLVYIILLHIFAYGLSVMFTNSIGPFRIFYRIRGIAEKMGPTWSYLLKCMFCFPSNVGWVFSLFNWFIVNQVLISPGNMILHGTGLWWLAAIMDACITGGICRLIWNIDDFIDKSTPILTTTKMMTRTQ